MAALDLFLERRRIAYLSIEIPLGPEIHTYSGALLDWVFWSAM